MLVYLLITAVTIYGKINIIGPSPSVLLGVQHHAYKTRAVRQRDHQFRLLEIAGWNWGDGDNRGDHVTKN